MLLPFLPKNKRIKQKKSFFSLNLNFGYRDEKNYFLENLAMLIESGMGILPALESIKAEVRSSSMLKVFTIIETEIESGSSLWQSLAKTGVFPSQVISLIRIGEESGQLNQNLKVVAIEQQKDREFRSKMRSAMMYPAIVLTLSLVVGIGIVWFILPHLSKVFTDLGIKLPFFTRILMASGKFLGEYGSIVVPTFIVIFCITIYFLFFFRRTRFIGEYILLRLPGFKKLLKEAELGRMGFILGTLLKAGVPVVESVGSLKEAATLEVYKKMYAFIEEKLEEGNSFQKSFLKYKKSRKLIPMPIQKMIISGEQSGKLPEIFQKISIIFEAKTEVTTKNLTAVLEPILLIIVWLSVMFLALGVIMPIYSLIGGLQQ